MPRIKITFAHLRAAYRAAEFDVIRNEPMTRLQRQRASSRWDTHLRAQRAPLRVGTVVYLVHRLQTLPPFMVGLTSREETLMYIRDISSLHKHMREVEDLVRDAWAVSAMMPAIPSAWQASPMNRALSRRGLMCRGRITDAGLRMCEHVVASLMICKFLRALV